MKLGVLCDGISRDVEHAFQVMNETGIEYAAFQNLWDKEVCEHSPAEEKKLKELVDRYNIKVSCITRHNFTHFRVMETDIKSLDYRREIDIFKKSIELAHSFGTRNVRVMVCKKEVNIWGKGGADYWLARNNEAWDRFLDIYREPLEIAEKEDIDLLAETSNDGMLTSGYLHRKFVRDLGSPRMKTLWDPANSIVGGDTPFPDGYEMVKDSLAELHIKDIRSDRVRSTVEFCKLGHGTLAQYLDGIADSLRRDNFQGVVTMESVFRPEGGSFEDGYRACLPMFKEVFGDR